VNPRTDPMADLLHRAVPAERWCVTKEDLRDVRRLVAAAVKEGTISPTSRDAFDSEDQRIGPSIYTVNQQFIKPETAAAGNMSWALMKHPEGLKCDLFVTHAWQEGIYEFIDKVLHAWPRDARHAYCCMLSNPQNLDISDLIKTPRSSPFARALESARYVLVVPNHNCSIYTRIWCAYEAFLAYSLQKIILTASAPIEGVTISLLCVAFAEGVGFLAGVCVHYILSTDDGSEEQFFWGFWRFVYIPFLMVNCVLLASLHFCSCYTGRVMQVTCIILALTIGFGSAFGMMRFLAIQVGILFAFACFAPFLGELERFRGLAFLEEAEKLTRGYTGSLRDAKCSDPSDGQRIRDELSSSGEEAYVDEAVGVLISAGMSTPCLREAAALVGELNQAGRWNSIHIYAASFFTFVYPLINFFVDTESLHTMCLGSWRWIYLLEALESIAWAVLFIMQRPDQRGFTVRCLALMTPIVLLFLLHSYLPDCILDRILGCLAFPLILGVSAAGIANTARLPGVGAPLVKLLLGHRPCTPGLPKRASPNLSTRSSEIKSEVLACAAMCPPVATGGCSISAVVLPGVAAVPTRATVDPPAAAGGCSGAVVSPFATVVPACAEVAPLPGAAAAAAAPTFGAVDSSGAAKACSNAEVASSKAAVASSCITGESLGATEACSRAAVASPGAATTPPCGGLGPSGATGACLDGTSAPAGAATALARQLSSVCEEARA